MNDKVFKYILSASSLLFLIAIVWIAMYSYTHIKTLSAQLALVSENINSLRQSLTSTSEELESTFLKKHDELSNALNKEQEKLGAFQSQVGNISNTVYTLQKLSQTDRELLKKYSKVYFLNENFVPMNLSEIPSEFTYSDKKKILLHSNVLLFFSSMIQSASSTGIQLYAQSGYRSFDEQKALKSDYRITYGAGAANTFSADQGYSEHQLGTAVDFISTGQGGVLDTFEKTKAFEWMRDNAHKYGFILSYTKNNGYFIYEPWHWRFVGVKLATDLHNQNKSFYSLDQRTIDSYLVSIFDSQ